jgi:ribosome-associated protein
MIRVTDSLSLDEREFHLEFIRSSGPGGQNVNKVATAVQLRFDAGHSPSLPEEVRERLIRLGGKRITKEGILILDARRFRTQEQNRQDAVQRLVDLIRRAVEKPKPRKKTEPTRGSRERRLESKHRRSETKRRRKPILEI